VLPCRPAVVLKSVQEAVRAVLKLPLSCRIAEH
jgi:hypothetical protein